MIKIKASLISALAFCAGVACAADWTGADDSRWSNDANWADNTLPGETDNVSFADWRIRYSANKVTVVDLEGTEKTVANIYVGTASDFPITVTNGTLRFTRCEIANQGSACELIVSNAMLVAENVTVGGNGWNGGGTGVVHQVAGSVVADKLCLGYGKNGAGSYVLEGGSAVFTNLNYGADIWTSKAGEGLFVLNGGTLSIDAINNGGCHGCEICTFVFNGGTLKLTADNSDLIPNWLTATVGEGGLCIDTDGHDVSINAGRISACDNAAALAKSGAGTLKLGDARTWAGPVSVLGGTLDLNGGTITGPLLLGGDGKIVNATIQTTDITIQDGYTLSPYGFATVSNEGVVQMTTLEVGGGSSTVAPVAGLIASAAGWYDPSDIATITSDENGGVTKIANKGSAGSMLDAEIVNDTGYITEQRHAGLELPYVGKLNGLDALVFTNNITGFQTHSHQFSDGSGKAVFAVSMRSDALVPEGAIESIGCVYPAEWCRGDWVWDTDNFLGVASMDGWHHLRYKLDDVNGSLKDVDWGDPSVTDWPERQMFDQMIYVSSIRSTDRGAEGKSSVYSRADRYDNGTLKVANGASEAVALQQSENMESRICIGWSKAPKWHDNEVGHIPSVTAGYIGEILAFDRAVSDFESEIIHAYLEHKWISSGLPAPQAKLSIGTLTLDGGTVGFEGSDITVGDLVGNGAMSDAAKVTVTGTITAKLVSDGAAIAVSASLDLTGTTLVLDEGAFALSQIGDMATVFTASSITGVPKIQLESEDKRKIKVRNTGTAITVTRLNPGFTLIVR